MTAAGDEIGWEYLTQATSSQFSISCFRKTIDKRYKMLGMHVNFMSRPTFTDWLLSWLVNFKIDFREQCILCGEDVDVVAADGTMIGIPFSRCSVDPIETTGSTPLDRSCILRRSDRQFFSFTHRDVKSTKQCSILARQDLKYFVDKNTNNLHDINFLSHEHANKVKKKCIRRNVVERSLRSDEEKKQNILNFCPEVCKDVLSRYIDLIYSQSTLCALSKIMTVFTTEKSLSSLINIRYVEEVLEVCENIVQGEPTSILHLMEYIPEVCHLITKAQKNDEVEDIVKLISFIARKVQYLHTFDQDPLPIIPKNDYNPEKYGRAYSFTSHGGTLREMPKYIDFNDTVEESSCRKVSYPHCSKSGHSYLFLIFDPMHYGHCHGFHIIQNEGPKDAFTAPLLYKKRAPRHYFYDNSCKLEEYSLNREPQFWRECEFWHDVFHGFHHKCPYTYNSRRINSLSTVNSEICEQFNSYIQKIAYSGRAMSQPRFIFYLQFFIHHWNQSRKLDYEKKMKTFHRFLE